MLSSSKELTIALISKGVTTDGSPISLMDDIEAFLTIYIGQHLSAGFEAADSLLHYINAYCNGKSLEDLTLAHIFTLEYINQLAHYILVVISDDEGKNSTESHSNFSALHSINMAVPPPAMQTGM